MGSKGDHWYAVERLLTGCWEASLGFGLRKRHCEIIGMRNVVVHGYDALDPARIQDAIDQSLPKLIEEIDLLSR